MDHNYSPAVLLLAILAAILLLIAAGAAIASQLNKSPVTHPTPLVSTTKP